MAIYGVVGDTLRTSIAHYDINREPIVGASFRVVLANRPDDSTFPVSFRELGDGIYEVSVETTPDDPAGEWFLVVEADNGYRYEESFDITGYRRRGVHVPGVAGERIRLPIHHYADGEPITGASFEVLVANRPDDSTFEVDFREIGEGMYEALVETNASDPEGEWFLVVEADNGFRYEGVLDVTGHKNQIIQIPSAPQFGASRLQLRRAIANQMGDLIHVVATSDGTEGMLVDAINLEREVNAFNGMQLYCVDAQAPANIGKLATVASSNPAARSINFNPELPQITKTGDIFDLYNYRDNGWRYDEYNQAINDAIMRGGDEHATIPAKVTLDEPFNRRFNLIEIPEQFTYFAGIDIIDRYGTPKSVPPAFYEVDKFTCEVSLKGRYIQAAHGKKLRLRGHRAPDLLRTDDDRTHLPTEWVVNEAVSILLQADLTHGVNQGARDRILNMQRGGADGRRPTIIGTYGPNTVKLVRGA